MFQDFPILRSQYSLCNSFKLVQYTKYCKSFLRFNVVSYIFNHTKNMEYVTFVWHCLQNTFYIKLFLLNTPPPTLNWTTFRGNAFCNKYKNKYCLLGGSKLKSQTRSSPSSCLLYYPSIFSRLQLLGSEITGFPQEKLYSGFSFLKWYASTNLESECYAKSGSTLVWNVAFLLHLSVDCKSCRKEKIIWSNPSRRVLFY